MWRRITDNIRWLLTGERSTTGYNAAEARNGSANWRPVGGTAEEINSRSRDIICQRSRDLERNSDITAAIITAFERNVVGDGFRVQANTGDDTINNAIEDMFDEWARPANCDIAGRQSFNELLVMAVRRMIVDGGMLFLKVTDKSAAVPFKLQAREVTDLDGSDYYHGTRRVYGGVEVDAYNKPLAYYLRDVTADGWATYEPKRVDAQNVIALWQIHRPSQVREISPLSVSLNRQQDADDYIATVGIKEKVLACLAVFIKKLNPTAPGLGRSSAGTGRLDVDPKTGYPTKRLTPGMIEMLQPGEDVQSVVPAGQAVNAREMNTIYTRLIGAGQGLSYEAISRDMSQVNYSSARQGALEDRKTYKRLQSYLIEHLLREVYEEVVTAAVLSGALTIPDFFKEKKRYLRHTWTAPGWPWIDPVKEVNANTKAMASGQETLATICAKNGTDWEEMLLQRAKEQAKIKELEEAYGVTLFGNASTQEGGDNGQTDEDTGGD